MKKKILIVGAILLVIIVGFAGWRLSGSNAQNQAVTQSSTLKKANLVESILVSGTVKSSQSKNVYSEVTSYPIKKVNVKVGDKIKVGDVLAQLDTTSLEFDIRQSKLNIQNSLHNQESALIDLEKAQDNYNITKELHEAGANSLDELKDAEAESKKAELSYKKATEDVEIQRASLEKQSKTLADSTIKSPIAGTITLVNAKEGESAAGLLFVIEDTDNLIVSSEIGEYDISHIKTGQEVIIKADSTGDKQFLGTVSKIAPTAIKDAEGNTDDPSNVQFDTEIAFKDTDPNIKIGMTVRLTIKLNEKKDVYSVPYDAIVLEADGSKWINVSETANNDNKSQNKQRKIKVQTGLETDMYVEIISPDLKDGMTVLMASKEAT